jgi:hypothetical protein
LDGDQKRRADEQAERARTRRKTEEAFAEEKRHITGIKSTEKNKKRKKGPGIRRARRGHSAA